MNIMPILASGNSHAKARSTPKSAPDAPIDMKDDKNWALRVIILDKVALEIDPPPVNMCSKGKRAVPLPSAIAVLKAVTRECVSIIHDNSWIIDAPIPVKK